MIENGNMSPADLTSEVKDTLDELRRRGYRLAIGSSSKNTHFILERIGLGNYFDAVADGNDIKLRFNTSYDGKGANDAASSIKAHWADIKAAFDYLGQTYTAECKTWVRKPVKSAKQTERETALKVGESKALTLKISPANATVKNAYWFSEDEAVATVDENGMVTAFSPGIVKIVAITWDGHYKATCTVTVEGESANG